MVYFMALAFAVGLGVPIAVLSAASAQGKAAAAALDGMARQPEATPKIQTAMILSLAFIESLVIFSLLVFFLMKASLPTTEDALKAITATSSNTMTR